ncbi:hypothetical protein GQ53DRAFT_698369, partial [Thozetella sp. PMI_491]
MEKTFHFVDVTQVDRAAQKSLRSYVQRGKNAGRKLHRPSKAGLASRPQVDSRTILQRHARAAGNAWANGQSWYPCKTIHRSPPGHVIQTVAFPYELSSYAVRVVDHFFTGVVDSIYPSKIGFSGEDSKGFWFQLLFSDEAVSRCSISLMEATSDFLTGRGTSSPEALAHLSRAFTLVKQRLKSDEALSDSTMMIIVMLITQEQVRNGRIDAEVHYAGLRRMVELRGGLDGLEHNLPLLLKICKTDLTYALQFGQPILFFRDRMPAMRALLRSRGFTFDQSPSASTMRDPRMDSQLGSLFLEAVDLAYLLNHYPTKPVVGIIEWLELLVSIGGRLVQLHPLQNTRKLTHIDAAYHIGLTVFIMTLFLQIDGRRVARYDLVTLHLRHALDGLEEGVEDALALWVMLVGAIWMSDGSDGSWLIERIAKITKRLGHDSWDDVLAFVGGFPWVHIMHDKPSRDAWMAAMALQQCSD